MNDILYGNINIIANSTLWFTRHFDVKTPEFSGAITRMTIAKVHEYYKNNGVDFDIETMKLAPDAMLYVYDHIMKIADLANMTAALGINPEDLQK